MSSLRREAACQRKSVPMTSTRSLALPTTPALNTSASGAARANARPSPFEGVRAFFRHHGALAPAVRLLRQIPLQAKVAVVASGFVSAAVLVGVAYAEKVLQVDRAARLAVEGSIHLRALTPLQDGTWMSMASPSPIGGAKLDAGLDRAWMQSLNIARGELPPGGTRGARNPAIDPAIDAAWDRLQIAWAAALSPPVASEPRVASLIDLSQAISEYRDRVVSASGLLRTPDPDTYLLASAWSTGLPALAESLAAASGRASATPPAGMGRETDVAQMALQRLRLQLEQMAPVHPSAEAETAAQAVLATSDAALRAARAGDGARFQALAGEALARIGDLERELASLLERALAQRLHDGRQDLLLVTLGVVFLLGVGVYLLIGFHRVMAGGLRSLSGEVRRMAEGDLSARPTPRGHDEVAEALQSLGGSLAMLSEMFATVRQGVAAVAQASEAIARGNGELAERTARTTRQLQQVVASVNLYMDQLDQSARRVDEAAGMVDLMRLEAARSRSNMSQLQARMQDLQIRSREIADIVSVIDGISFRTSVLALNASIEAAKAGESGRGFAVVAQEVRRLARRSTESARSIQDIVARSTEDIVQGAALADRTGEALKATDLHVARVHESMQQIVHLTRGGEANSHAILDSIHELDQLTGENGVLVEQIAAASIALSGSGNELSRRAENFKLG